MNAIEVIVTSFRDAQSAVREDVVEVDDDLFWWQPAEGLNHIGFLFWHLVRDEDTVVSYAAGEPELWAADGWHARFGMDAKEQGTGLDPARISAFRYDRALFMAYAGAVWARTPALVSRLSEDDLDRQAWPESDWTVATQLVEGSIGHAWVHLGEMRAIKGLRGWRFRE
jgi:hypothetical protein